MKRDVEEYSCGLIGDTILACSWKGTGNPHLRSLIYWPRFEEVHISCSLCNMITLVLSHGYNQNSECLQILSIFMDLIVSIFRVDGGSLFLQNIAIFHNHGSGIWVKRKL
jgi:hypothetical protein